jgi:protein gp37
MAKRTEIEWCKSTLNLWIGCDRISPACDHCYAQDWDRRFHAGAHWGPDAQRLKTSQATWNHAYTWDRQARDTVFAGRKGFWPVFVNSLSDFFDNQVDVYWRDQAWKVMRECRHLTFILVTKRVGNVPAMLPSDWLNMFGDLNYPHVWILATVWDQASADRDIPKLFNFCANVRGVSLEPMLGPVDISAHLGMHRVYLKGDELPYQTDLDWVIVGAETGSKARPLHPDHVRTVRDQCQESGTAFFFKHWGAWAHESQILDNAMLANRVYTLEPDEGGCHEWDDGTLSVRVLGKDAGRFLDGRAWSEFPQQEVPF